MEVYTLDNLLRRETVVDRFESIIWTERFSAYGDFELVLNSTLENRRLFVTGTRLALNESYRVMTVETIEDKTDSEGRNMLTLKGRSLEMIMEDRVAKKHLNDLGVEAKWGITGTVYAITMAIFRTMCTTYGTEYLDPADPIPFYVQGTIFPADTNPMPSEAITVWIEPDTVYKVIKDLCDIYDLGFRLYRNFDTSQLRFDIYAGSNRTTTQTTFPAVVFSPDLDNLQNTSELTTMEMYKNVAYVFTEQGFAVVYPEEVDPTTAGFERRVLLVKPTDITVVVPDTVEETAAKAKQTTASNLESNITPTSTAGEKLAATNARSAANVAQAAADLSMAAAERIAVEPQLRRRGLEELAKCRRYSAFDGEINQNSDYKYGLNYNLGDMVEMRNVDGVTNKMQVTEQIFVSDKEGDRSYPTLAINQFIEPGSWIAWKYNQFWVDLENNPEETWAVQE
jgi:hypothetical protein